MKKSIIKIVYKIVDYICYVYINGIKVSTINVLTGKIRFAKMVTVGGYMATQIYTIQDAARNMASDFNYYLS